MSGTNIDVNNFIKNVTVNSANTGSCGLLSDDLKYSSDNSSPPNNQKQLFDYYVCGADPQNPGPGKSVAPTAYGYCKGMVSSEWNSVWSNCKDNPDSDNIDECYNMVTQDSYNEAAKGHPSPIGCAMRTHTDGTSYDPVTGQWTGDGAAAPAAGTGCSRNNSGLQGTLANYTGFDNWSNDWTTQFGERPAYPNDNEPLDDFGDRHLRMENANGVLAGGFSQALETSEDVTPHKCPSTEWRDFRCAGDGSSDDNGDLIPGCGTGREWNDTSDNRHNGHQDVIRFCARPSEEYDINNLFSCCLNDGDIDKLSNRSCPVGYCLTKIKQDTSIEAGNTCTSPFGTDTDNLDCYQMSDKCSDLFSEVCTAELFNIQRGSEKWSNKVLNKQIYCRKWAEIQPNTFDIYQEGICNIKTRLKEYLSDDISNKEINEQIEEIRTLLSSNLAAKNVLLSFFKSDLCRDWLIKSGETVELLRGLCGEKTDTQEGVVEKFDCDENGENCSWRETGFGRKLGDICPCYYPNEYYTWYKNTQLIESERDNMDAQTGSRPECYHRDCQLSGIYDPSVTGHPCPNVQICRNTINANIRSNRNAPGYGEPTNTSVDLSNLTGSGQACNFTSVNSEFDNTTVDDQFTGQTGSSGTGSSGTGSSGTGSSGTGSSGTSDYDDSSSNPFSVFDNGFADNDDGTSSNEDESNSGLYIIMGILCCCFMILIIIITSGGKGGNRGYYPPMPPMPNMNYY